MKSKTRKHILLLPFPAYGHMTPLSELGKKIAKHHDVTFAVSESMFEQIQKRELVSKDDFALVSIPDGFVIFDADNVTNTENFAQVLSITYPAIKKFLAAIPTNGCTSPASSDAVGITTPVDVVIGDNMFAGPLAVCHERGIPYHFFNTAAASLTLGSLFTDENYPELPEGETGNLFTVIPEPGGPLPPMPAVFKSLLNEMYKTNHLVSGIVFNSVREVEEDIINAIQQFPHMKDIPMRCVGPLMPAGQKISTKNLEQQTRVQTWLDGKKDTSVVYVSFGSIAAPGPEQIAEIAKALLALDRPFVWSLAQQNHQHLPEEITSRISEQFDKPDSPFLVLSWAPQKLILQHPAVSVFLSHCGWNSTMESVAAGVPVVAWPMFGDQKINAEWLAKQSTAIMVEGTGQKGTRLVMADEIEKTFRAVGGESDSGETTYRQAAHTMRAKLDIAVGPGGSSDVAFQSLIEFAD